MWFTLKHPAKISGSLFVIGMLRVEHPKVKKKRKCLKMTSTCGAQLIKRGPQQGDIFLIKRRSCTIKRAAIRD